MFAVLCDEISELKITAETNFYPALVMFGMFPDGDGDEELKDGEEEMQWRLWRQGPKAGQSSAEGKARVRAPTTDTPRTRPAAPR